MYLQEFIIIGLVSAGLTFYITLLLNNDKVTKIIHNWINPLVVIALVTTEFSCWQVLPSWQYLLLSYVCALGIQYLVVLVIHLAMLKYKNR